MSARSVCSGSCPCRYHSDRAISAPFRRPDTRTLIPRAPNRSADSTALRVALGLLDLLDVDEDLAVGPLLDLGLQLVDLRPLPADDDSRTRGVDVDLQLVRRALDLDLRHTGVREPLLERVAQLEILVQELRVVLVGEPARAPGLIEPEPEAVRMNFLAHYAFASLFFFDEPLATAPLRRGRFCSWPCS